MAYNRDMLRLRPIPWAAGLAAGALALAASAASGPSPVFALEPPALFEPVLEAQEGRAPSDWATLSAEWESALAEWDAAYEEAGDIKRRRELRENHPAFEFWPRFDALSRTDGRAAAWLVEFAGRAGHRGENGREIKAQAYARAFADEAALHAGWFEPFLVTLGKDRRAVGDEAYLAYLEQVIAETRADANRARAWFLLGQWLVEQDDEELKARGLELLDRAAALSETPAARDAEALAYELRNLVIGAVAPDFTGPTADGGTFTLSEHRGKIVVLDFFGFW